MVPKNRVLPINLNKPATFHAIHFKDGGIVRKPRVIPSFRFTTPDKSSFPNHPFFVFTCNNGSRRKTGKSLPVVTDVAVVTSATILIKMPN